MTTNAQDGPTGIFVSIIVPTYNECNSLKECLHMVLSQDYPRNFYEVIVVDNGSTDDTRSIAQSYKDVIVLAEADQLSSPYSARNRGIEIARGEVIVLLDANCVPSPSWLTEGIATLQEEEADLVGGDVQFSFSKPVTTAQLLDALTNIRMKESITERGVAKTANLFVKRAVFTVIGLFPEGIRSGGDVSWTHTAVRAGHKLVFSEHALVWKKARPFKELVRKQWRVAKGQPSIRQSQGNRGTLWRIILQAVTNPPHRTLLRSARERGGPYTDHSGRLCLLLYAIHAVMLVGNLYAMVIRSLKR